MRLIREELPAKVVGPIGRTRTGLRLLVRRDSDGLLGLLSGQKRKRPTNRTLVYWRTEDD